MIQYNNTWTLKYVFQFQTFQIKHSDSRRHIYQVYLVLSGNVLLLSVFALLSMINWGLLALYTS